MLPVRQTARLQNRDLLLGNEKTRAKGDRMNQHREIALILALCDEISALQQRTGTGERLSKVHHLLSLLSDDDATWATGKIPPGYEMAWGGEETEPRGDGARQPPTGCAASVWPGREGEDRRTGDEPRSPRWMRRLDLTQR